jgi:hypothetical protein
MVEEAIDIRKMEDTTSDQIAHVEKGFQTLHIAFQIDFGIKVFVQDEMDNKYLNLRDYFYKFTIDYLFLHFFLLLIPNLYFLFNCYFASF